MPELDDKLGSGFLPQANESSFLEQMDGHFLLSKIERLC